MAQPDVVGTVMAASPSPAIARPAGTLFPALRPDVMGWCRRHPVLADAAWVTLLAALTGADLPHQGHWVDLAWQLALWLPVVFRRVAPVAVFVVVGMVAAGQWA